eukprot:EG_transcript_21275
MITVQIQPRIHSFWTKVMQIGNTTDPYHFALFAALCELSHHITSFFLRFADFEKCFVTLFGRMAKQETSDPESNNIFLATYQSLRNFGCFCWSFWAIDLESTWIPAGRTSLAFLWGGGSSQAGEFQGNLFSSNHILMNCD